jgi:hypothetical protein
MPLRGSEVMYGSAKMYHRMFAATGLDGKDQRGVNVP